MLIGTLGNALQALSQIPVIFIIREAEADSSFREDHGRNAFIERGRIETQFGSERVSNNAKPLVIDFRQNGEVIQDSFDIPHPLSHAGPLRMAKRQVGYGLIVIFAIAFAPPPDGYRDISVADS